VAIAPERPALYEGSRIPRIPTLLETPEGLDDVIEMLVAICQRYGKDYEHRVCLWYGP